jgi:hypothetical protein
MRIRRCRAISAKVRNLRALEVWIASDQQVHPVSKPTPTCTDGRSQLGCGVLFDPVAVNAELEEAPHPFEFLPA